MANDEYREQHERDRARGLVARQETRLQRANVVQGVHGDEVKVVSTSDYVWLVIGGLEVALMPNAARLLAQSLILRAVEIETPGIEDLE